MWRGLVASKLKGGVTVLGVASISDIGAPYINRDFDFVQFSFNKLGLRIAEKDEVSVYKYL